MLDKDFDAFFKSSFEDYEVAPAADSWTKISEQINPKSKKKSFPVFWMAAASIIILFGIGIGFYTQPTNVIKLHPDEGNEVLANLALKQDDFTTEKELPKPEIKYTKKAIERTKSTVMLQKVIEKAEEKTEEVSSNEALNSELTSVQNVKPIRPKLVTEQLIAQEEIKDLKKADATLLSDNSSSYKNTVMASATPRKMRISSVGDLVNFVVAKVDKRDDKIIKLSKTEESDNEITGINLGLIKFTKQD